ncbi:hypothetical protein [Micromonospora sp. NPDC048830]|uniref:hypothetical protein n=1 Tax=Micromonospora sp. NPDC048830 TaxID=3364257 RepID=UPI00371AFA3B
MRIALVLGAGFSRAISDEMPLTDELGEEIRARLPQVRLRTPRGFRNQYFEAWLSRLAEPQPDLTAADNATNQGLFLEVAQELHRVMQERELLVLHDRPEWWLQRLVGIAHAVRATVITFNYDTLVERAVEYSVLSDWDPSNSQAKSFNLVRDIPPSPNRGGWIVDRGSPSFRLLKLHGSLDNYWVPGDLSGATIQRLPLSGRWGQPIPPSEQLRREQLPGREPFIVPPAAAKSSFYNNPISRELWQSAARALADADRVALVGYSLPQTDLVASGMLTDTVARANVQVDVVNPDPSSIVRRLENLGIGGGNISSIDGRTAIASYTDQLERMVGRQVHALLADADGSRSLMVGTSPYRTTRVVGFSRVGDALRLVVDKVTHAEESTRLIPDQRQSVVSVAELQKELRDGDCIEIAFADGTSTRIVSIAEWLTSTGLGNGKWAILIPSALPAPL